MNTLDILILVVLLTGLVKGWLGGFFRQLASMVGFVMGVLLAFVLYRVLGDWLAPCVGGSQVLGRALAFILIGLGCPLALSLLAFVVTKAVETVSLGGLNRLAGAVLGGLKYLLFLSCLLNVGAKVRVIPGAVSASSILYEPVCGIASVVYDICEPHVARTVSDVVSSGVGNEE